MKDDDDIDRFDFFDNPEEDRTEDDDMERFDFSNPEEDRNERAKRSEREKGRTVNWDGSPRSPEEQIWDGNPKHIQKPAVLDWGGKFLLFFGWLLFLLCIPVVIGVGGYAVYIWWGVIENLDFLEFSVALVLFFVTIPLAPIYVGIHGNWEPAIYLGVGLFVRLQKNVDKELI